LTHHVLVVLLFLSPFSVQPQALDQSVREFALSLRNHLADPAMVAISQLSRWPVPILSAMALLLWLLGAGRRNAATHWLIAIGGGGLIQLLLAWSLRATPQVIELGDTTVRGPSAAMTLMTVLLAFFAVMLARVLRRRHRQWPYLAAALILTLLGLARLYLGLEWLSGAMMGVMLGLAWAAMIGIAYRQRARHTYSGSVACLIFYGSMFVLFSWQVQEHAGTDMLALRTTYPTQEISAEGWWQSNWQQLPVDRTRLVSVASRRFNAQVAVDPQRIAELLVSAGWERVPETDWRWILQALNPEPDQASLPLLGRAFQGRSEQLLLRKNTDRSGYLLTVRMWDSGFRAFPGNQTIYLAQLSEEKLVQRFGLFSYWHSVPVTATGMKPVRDVLFSLDQKLVNDGLLLLREPE
jgi:undecaprenyl-diphosphatase